MEQALAGLRSELGHAVGVAFVTEEIYQGWQLTSFYNSSKKFCLFSSWNLTNVAHNLGATTGSSSSVSSGGHYWASQ